MNKKKKILNKITIIVLNFSTKKWSNLLIKLILKMPLHVIIVELIFIIIYDNRYFGYKNMIFQVSN